MKTIILKHANACEAIAEEFLLLPATDRLFTLLTIPGALECESPALSLMRDSAERFVEVADEEDAIKTIAIDRAKLLREVEEQGIKAPYESRWTGKSAASNIADINRFCDKFGIGLSGQVRESPEHIGMEFALMALLIRRWAEAGTEGAEAAVAQCWREHLAGWVRNFAEAMKAEASTVYYQAVATFVIEEAVAIDELLSEVGIN